MRRGAALATLLTLLLAWVAGCRSESPDKLERRIRQACVQYFEGDGEVSGYMVSSRKTDERAEELRVLTTMKRLPAGWNRWEESLESFPVGAGEYVLRYTLVLAYPGGSQSILEETFYCDYSTEDDPIPLKSLTFSSDGKGSSRAVSSHFLWRGDFDLLCTSPKPD